MPLGVVNDIEFAREIANSSADGSSPIVPDGNDSDDENLAPRVNDDSLANVSGEIQTLQRGRGNAPATPLALQQLIGEAGISSRRESVELATLLGISPSSASAYANGSSSTASYNKPKPELFDFIATKKLKIAKRASHKLALTLNAITEDKLENANIVQLSMVAKNMSGIIKDMEPEKVNPNQGNNFNGPSIVMFAPPIVDESKFQSITVQE